MKEANEKRETRPWKILQLILFVVSLVLFAIVFAAKPTTTDAVETFCTRRGLPVAITLIKHGTLALSCKDITIHVDPVGGYGKPTDYETEFPKADVILITHEHGDHLDKDAIAALAVGGAIVALIWSAIRNAVKK